MEGAGRANKGYSASAALLTLTSFGDGVQLARKCGCEGDLRARAAPRRPVAICGHFLVPCTQQLEVRVARARGPWHGGARGERACGACAEVDATGAIAIVVGVGAIRLKEVTCLHSGTRKERRLKRRLRRGTVCVWRHEEKVSPLEKMQREGEREGERVRERERDATLTSWAGRSEEVGMSASAWAAGLGCRRNG